MPIDVEIKPVRTVRGYYHVILAMLVGGTITVIHEVLYRLAKGSEADLDTFGVASHGTGDMLMLLIPLVLILAVTEASRPK